MSIREAFAQGYRCGHIDGNHRCGSYVVGEEQLLDEEAEVNGNVEFLDPKEREAWQHGYRVGYITGAEGEPLPLAYQYPVERKPSTWE